MIALPVRRKSGFWTRNWQEKDFIEVRFKHFYLLKRICINLYHRQLQAAHHSVYACPLFNDFGLRIPLSVTDCCPAQRFTIITSLPISSLCPLPPTRNSDCNSVV